MAHEMDRLLNRSLGFMLSVTSRKVTLMLAHRLKAYDISPEQWSVLYHIADREGMLQKEIAERTGKDRPTVTRILDSLESKGLIVKKAGTEDRRSVHVYSTEKGKELADAAAPMENEVKQELESMLGTEAYDQMLRLLGRLDRLTEDRIAEGRKPHPHD